MSSYRIATLRGIPIRVHITLVVLLPLYALAFAPVPSWMGVVWGFVLAAALFASIVLHEMAHAWVALRKGCRVQEILLLPIGGMAKLREVPRRARDEFQMAAAGPLASLLLGLICRWTAPWAGHELLRGLLQELAAVNIMLAFFNLIPSFPMDGGRIFRAWLQPKVGRILATRIAAGVGKGLAWVMGLIGLFRMNPLLVFIAFFIHRAATAEYQSVLLREGCYNRSSMGDAWRDEFQDEDPRVEVSPPPWEASRPESPVRRMVMAQKAMFEELFRKWRD